MYHPKITTGSRSSAIYSVQLPWFATTFRRDGGERNGEISEEVAPRQSTQQPQEGGQAGIDHLNIWHRWQDMTLSQPPLVYLKWPPNRWAYRAEFLQSLWRHITNFLEETSQVRSRSYDVIKWTTSHIFFTEIIISIILVGSICFFFVQFVAGGFRPPLDLETYAT